MQETSGQPAAVNFNCCSSGEGQGHTALCRISCSLKCCRCALLHTHSVYSERWKGLANTSLVQNVFLHRIEIFGGLVRAYVSLKE